ncbi:hypothetical protein C8R43DRAFT_1007561 [Mycena crocata]|nr:hypothetical protein C8R43DRAFT_1007561 [Mycena crocata]
MFKARHVQLPVSTEVNTAELDPQLYNDDYYHARYQMLWLQRTQRCMHLLCPMDPTTARAITNLTLCRRCMVVRYCGPECQRAAWDADMLPHRDLCNNVCAVRHSVGMDYKRNKKNTEKKTKDNDETDRSDKQWSQWLMRAGVVGAVATFKEKGVHETRCR